MNGKEFYVAYDYLKPLDWVKNKKSKRLFAIYD
jgi:hypothetical protein